MTKTDLKTVQLKRSVSLPFLVFYGLGAIIGGGIYALLGKVAGVAGLYTPVAFLVSSLLAMVSLLAYAELSARHPLSAGEVRYVGAAFNSRFLCVLVGWLLAFVGAVSSAVLIKATNGFIQDFYTLPEIPLTLVLIALLGGVAAWGITQSVALVSLITVIEVGGLLLVIIFGGNWPSGALSNWAQFIPPTPIHDMTIWLSIFSGAFLAFYAFIGFEDMVNIAEEVKDAEKTLPRAILICFCLTLLIYLLISLVAVTVVAPAELAASNTPLATIMEKSGSPIPPGVMITISILAAINGVLVQMIMSARILYGMGNGGEAPAIFARVNQVTQTPLLATFTVVGGVIILALLADLVTLAKITSGTILFIFALVNLALVKIKFTDKQKVTTFTIPVWMPMIGFAICVVMLVFELWQMIG